MIKLTTTCNNCVHKDLCKYKGNAEYAMKRLKEMNYGDGPNDDYSWEVMMECEHVDITFSCPNFREDVSVKDTGLLWRY